MMELVFVVCLAVEPDSCERRAMQFTDLTTTTCALGAQPELARWIEEHPGWRISRWSCKPLDAELDA